MLDSAQAAAERALIMDSTLYGAHYVLAMVFALNGRQADAEREITRRLRALGDTTPLGLADAAELYRLAGRPDLAREMLRRLEALARRQQVSPVFLAGARLAAGDRTGALDALEAAARDHDLNSGLSTFRTSRGAGRRSPLRGVRKRVFGDIPAPRSLVRRSAGEVGARWMARPPAASAAQHHFTEIGEYLSEDDSARLGWRVWTPHHTVREFPSS